MIVFCIIIADINSRKSPQNKKLSKEFQIMKTNNCLLTCCSVDCEDHDHNDCRGGTSSVVKCPPLKWKVECTIHGH